MDFKDFTATTQTAQGAPTKNVKWNSAGQCYIGQVWDETREQPDKWRSCIWSKTGKNRTRPEFNLA